MNTNFELNTVYTLTTEKGMITPVGKSLIEGFIASIDLLKSPEWTALNPTNVARQYLPQLPDVDEWGWCWKVASGYYRGTFPKRVSKYYKTVINMNCPDSFITRIGNLARQHSLEPVVYTFDFVNYFDWDSGDFGDEGSCYWTDREDAREILARNGCLAIRFYEGDEGIARAWLYPAENFYVVFNGHGMTTLEIAKLFATWQGLDYKKIHLLNNDTSGGLIWINGSGAGYIVGEADNIKTSHYDLRMYTPDRCERCGDEMDEDRGYETPNGEMYCRDCFYDYYGYCHECDDTFHQNHLIYVESEEIDVCEACLRRNFTRCDYCSEYWRDERVSEDKQGRAICEGCSDRD
jgi:hypothetical protein